MDLRIFTEPQQGASYDDQLAGAPATEDCGFDGLFRSDHYLAMGGDGRRDRPTAWITLAGLARDTSTHPARHAGHRRRRSGIPGLAISVAQVDAMSGGRVELGLGTGWFDDEHAAYGIPFPAPERFALFEEQLAIITGLWPTPVGERFRFAGDALHAHRIAGPAQAGASRRPADHRRRRTEARRRGSQHGTRPSSTSGSRSADVVAGAVRPGARPATRSGATLTRWSIRGADRLLRRRRRRGPPPSKAIGDDADTCARRGRRHAGRGASRRSGGTASSAPIGATSRSSTWATSTTST